MSGRAATTDVILGDYALSVGLPPKQLPEGWEWHSLTEIAELATGHTPSRRHPEYWDGDIPWIGIKDARTHHGTEINSTLQHTNQLGLDNSASVLLPPSTVCLSRTASVGYVTIMGKPMATSQDFVNWICTSALLPKYLMHLFIAEKQSLFRFGKGTTHTTIYFPEVKALHVGLPPVPEQRRIVDKIEELFSDLDAGVAALERAKANLKRYRAAVLKAAVEGKLTEEWRAENPDVEPASELLERILAERRQRWEAEQLAKYEEKGKKPPKGWEERYKGPVDYEWNQLPALPASWKWISLGSVAWNVKDGPHYSPKYSDSGVPFISTRNITPDGIDFSTAKYISKELHEELCERCKPESGDILYTKGGSTGIACVNRENVDFNVWVHVAVLKIVETMYPDFVKCALNSPLCFAQAQRYTHGVGNQDLGLTRMIKIAIPLAPFPEQQEIVRIVDERLSVLKKIEQEIDTSRIRASRLRQSILKRAFEGKLVPQNPDDEPASELLEWIKAEREVAEAEEKKAKKRARKK